MPKGESAKTMLRQWSLLRNIPAQLPGITVRTLNDRLLNQEGYKVSLRTIERDMNELSTIFPLVVEDSKRPYHWYWMQGRETEFPGMSLNDALCMQMLKTYLTELLPGPVFATLGPKFRNAEEILNKMASSSSIADWTNKVRVVHPTLPLVPPKINPEALECVQKALLEDRQIEVEYQSAHSDKSSTHRLHPHALIQRGVTLYLVAGVFDYVDLRLYAIHRIKKASLLPDKIKRNKSFNLDGYLAKGNLEFSQGKKIKLKAWVSYDLGNILRETPLSEDMKMTEVEDGYEIKATVYDSWQLQWWIQSQVDDIMVYGPAILKRNIKETLTAAAEYYSISD